MTDQRAPRMAPQAGSRPAPQHPNCPACGKPMGIKLITPTMFAERIDDTTYGCESCGAEVKRSIKRT